jgi:membrane fusion protein, copper/silver efflux system
MKQMDEDPGIGEGAGMDHRDGGRAKRNLLGGLGGPWTAPLVGGFVVVMVVVAFLAGRSTASAGPAVHDHDHVLEEQLAEAESGDRWFTCSMHPQVRTTDPNERCPICGMELIPVAADAEDEGDPSLPLLAVSPRSAALMQVETYPVERRSADRSLRLYGRIDYDETGLRSIASRVSGRLERLHVDFTGQQVRAGDPMVVIYSPTLVAAQEELLQSLAAQRELPPDPSPRLEAGTHSRVEASRDKLRLLGLGPEQIQAMETTGRVEETLTLPAPLDGVVIAREATEGSYVETGQPIYTLADLSRVWVTLEVHERDAQWVRVGQQVAFTVQALPGEGFLGRVAFVQPTVHDEARTVQVRVELPNPSGRLKPGMFATGELQAPLLAAGSSAGATNPLVIPASAPLLTGKRAIVYVQLPDTDRPTFEGREVVLGPRVGDWYVVTEGLYEGEMVVTRGNFRIDSELQIRGRPSMMAPQGGGAPVHDHGAAAHDPGALDVERVTPAASQPRAATPDEAAHQHDPAPESRAPGEPAHQHDPAGIPSRQTPPAFAEQVGALVRANFDLVQWLADDDPEEARRAATATLDALGRVDVDLLEGAARDIWAPLQVRMRSGLTALVEEEDFEEMRTHFETFSDPLILAVRTFGTGSVAPVYRAMCPMVKGREGFWLAPRDEITNPYHGSRMYSCGSIVEVMVPPTGGVPQD